MSIIEKQEARAQIVAQGQAYVERLHRSAMGEAPYNERREVILDVMNHVEKRNSFVDTPERQDQLKDLHEMHDEITRACHHREEWLHPDSKEEKSFDKQQAQEWEQRPGWMKQYEQDMSRDSGPSR
jgi:antitoxin component of MazEF toxin-antitoxin module